MLVHYCVLPFAPELLLKYPEVISLVVYIEGQPSSMFCNICALCMTSDIESVLVCDTLYLRGYYIVFCLNISTHAFGPIIMSSVIQPNKADATCVTALEAKHFRQLSQ